MSICIAVLAHEGAKETIAEFQPQWERLGLPIHVFLPEGDKWPGTPVDAVYNQGTSAHRGQETYDRFIRMAETLLKTDYEMFVMMEYDTVNLVDDLPDFNRYKANCAFLETNGEDVARCLKRNHFYIALSPWIWSRSTIEALLPFMKIPITEPQEVEWIDGLLDRWIAMVVLNQRAVKAGNITRSYSWPVNDPIAHEKIKHFGMIWVHGWKRKSDFLDLWPLHS